MCAVAEHHTAGGVDLLNGQLGAVFIVGAVSGQAAGQRADQAKGNGVAAAGCGTVRCGVISGAAAAGDKTEGQAAGQQQRNNFFHFHQNALLVLILV